MTEPQIENDAYADDPFFKRVYDGQWNACIGRQGHEENYLDGYIEAAIELADAVIDKQMFAKRDTLVLPILYNARHAIELALKFVTDRLIRAGVIKSDGRKRDHNIKAYWDRLQTSAVGDEKLAQGIRALKPYVDSLSRIDSDGQELRYHKNREDDPSLSAYAVANLRLIQASLRAVEKLISDLKYRTLDFVDEYETGVCTNRCSRRDLLEIARLMPQRDQWSTPVCDTQKAAVKARYGLSNKQFSIALDRIQGNREMRAILGMESDPLHLSDDDIVWIIEQWRRVHPQAEGDETGSGEFVSGLDYFDTARLAAMQEGVKIQNEVARAIETRLSEEELADLEAMFYLARDNVYSEYYDAMVARTLKEHASAKAPGSEIMHLLEKTNLLQCIQIASVRLGRLALAARLKTM
jgi:hypothetical protein